MMFWFLSSGQSSAPHLQGIPSGSLRWRSWSWTASARANPWQAGQVTGCADAEVLRVGRAFAGVVLKVNQCHGYYPLVLAGLAIALISSAAVFEMGEGRAASAFACARFQATRQRAPQNFASLRVALLSAPQCWHWNLNQYQRCLVDTAILSPFRSLTCNTRGLYVTG